MCGDELQPGSRRHDDDVREETAIYVRATKAGVENAVTRVFYHSAAISYKLSIAAVRLCVRGRRSGGDAGMKVAIAAALLVGF